MSKPGWERSTVKSAWGDTNLLILQYLEGYLPIRTKWHGHDASSSNFPILDNPVEQERFILRGVSLSFSGSNTQTGQSLQQLRAFKFAICKNPSISVLPDLLLPGGWWCKLLGWRLELWTMPLLPQLRYSPLESQMIRLKIAKVGDLFHIADQSYL